MRPIGKTNVFKHSKNKYSSGGKTWNCSLWKKWLYEGNGEPGVQSKKTKTKRRFSSGRVLKKLTGISQGPPKTVACTTLWGSGQSGGAPENGTPPPSKRCKTLLHSQVQLPFSFLVSRWLETLCFIPALTFHTWLSWFPEKQ